VNASITLVVRRTINAPVARVFEAWTEPRHLLRWWGPRPVICSQAEVDLRAGGAYRIGNQLPDGTVVWISGEFEVVDPPKMLVYSWRVEGRATPSGPSRVTVRFESRSGGTEVVVLHERIDSEETRVDHEHGWNGCLDNLESLFAAVNASSE
jgi:uncharacterized protein YndB with AHSA1/START domain